MVNIVDSIKQVAFYSVWKFFVASQQILDQQILPLWVSDVTRWTKDAITSLASIPAWLGVYNCPGDTTKTSSTRFGPCVRQYIILFISCIPSLYPLSNPTCPFRLCIPFLTPSLNCLPPPCLGINCQTPTWCCIPCLTPYLFLKDLAQYELSNP